MRLRRFLLALAIAAPYVPLGVGCGGPTSGTTPELHDADKAEHTVNPAAGPGAPAYKKKAAKGAG
jgi:hypothetical protein